MQSTTTRRNLRRRAAVVAVLIAGILAAGCTTHQVPAISTAALAQAKTYKSYTVYWAGTDVDGARITQVDSPLYFYAPVGFTFYYGNCASRGGLHDGGCVLPLKITTSIYSPHSDASFGPQRWTVVHGVPAVIYDGGDDIELYTDKMNVDIVANNPARAAAAVEALRPFNRKWSIYFPEFPKPSFTPNPSQAALNAGITGPTGATGATSSVGPPPSLEPSPSTGPP